MTLPITIPFNRCFAAPNELAYTRDVLESGRFGVSGVYLAKCEEWLRRHLSRDALMTQSCTDALELAAMLAEVDPGDEVILPSYTFSSTANAFALRGATLVFVDIDPVTLNIDPAEVEKAVTKSTRAIVAVDYAGHPCDMRALRRTADQHDLVLIEDAAQSLMAYEDNEPVGTKADLSTFSFHNTKNIHCGEGGALLINASRFSDRAAMLAEKGTNRKQFFLGHVDKYTWVDIGTSALPSELTCAMLYAQFEMAEEITAMRRESWAEYEQGLRKLEDLGLARLPRIPAGVRHNAHMFYMLMHDRKSRDELIQGLRALGISAPFHYIPLHSAPAGLRRGRAQGSMRNTDRISSTIVRLPLWPHVPADEVIRSIFHTLGIERD